MKRLRRELGWSQLKMGNHVGVSRQRITQYEAGTHKAPPDVLWAMIDIAREYDIALTMAELVPRPE